MPRRSLILLCLAALTTAPPFAHADATLAYAVNGDACSAGIGQLTVKGKRLRWDLLDGSASAIFDGFESTLVSLDHRQKQLFEMDVDFDTLDYKEDVMASADRKLSPSMRALQGRADDQDCQRVLKEMPREEAPPGAAPIQIGNCEISADGRHARATAAPGMFGAGAAMPGMTPEQMQQIQQSMQSLGAPGAEDAMPAMSQAQMQQLLAGMTAGAGSPPEAEAAARERRPPEADAAARERHPPEAGTAAQNPGAAAATRPGADAELAPVEADFEHPAIVAIPAGGVMGSMAGMLGQHGGSLRVEATETSAEIAGIRCTEYLRFLDDRLLAQECWARNADLPLDPADIATLTQASLAVGMMQNMGDQNRAAARRSAARETLVSRKCSGELGSVQLEVTKDPVAADVFEIPPGYAPAMSGDEVR